MVYWLFGYFICVIMCGFLFFWWEFLFYRGFNGGGLFGCKVIFER